MVHELHASRYQGHLPRFVSSEVDFKSTVCVASEKVNPHVIDASFFLFLSRVLMRTRNQSSNWR